MNLQLKRGEQPPRRLLQVVSNNGGLGDGLARLVSIRETLRNDKNVDIRLFITGYMLPLIERMPELQKYVAAKTLEVYDFKSLPEHLNKQQAGIMFGERSFTPSRMSLIDDGFLTLTDGTTRIDGKPIIYKGMPKIETSQADLDHPKFNQLINMDDEGRSFVIVTTGFTSITRSWNADDVNELTAWLKRKNYVPVFLGAATNTYVKTSLPEVNTDGCIDLRDQTTLIQALEIINKAVLLVGVDNGLMHLAACGENSTPIVGGYTTINPEYRDLHNLLESIEPDEELSCRFCQSKYNFAFQHDFRTCMYGDLKCVSQMTAGKFIKASARVLNESVE